MRVRENIMPKKTATPAPKEALAVVKREATEVQSLAKTVERLVVDRDAEYAVAAGLIGDLKAKKKEVDAARKSITDPLDQAKKATMALFNPITHGLDELIGQLNGKIVGYLDAKAAEAQKKVEKEAKALEKKGLADMARDVRRDAAESVIPDVPGTTIRSTWHAECMDLVLLVEAVAAGKVPHDFLQLNEKYANALARAVKDASKAPPGVRYVEEKYTQSGGVA